MITIGIGYKNNGERKKIMINSDNTNRRGRTKVILIEIYLALMCTPPIAFYEELKNRICINSINQTSKNLKFSLSCKLFLQLYENK